MTRRASLLVVGEDFEVKLRSYSGKEGYRVVRKIDLKDRNIELDLKATQEKIKELQEKYPDKGFFFEKHMVINNSIELGESIALRDRRHMAHRMLCWIIGRRNPDRKLRKKDVPVYWNGTYKRLYVPKSYYERQKRLTCSVIMYRLRDLGISFTLAYA